jgi:hypothetical protein
MANASQYRFGSSTASVADPVRSRLGLCMLGAAMAAIAAAAFSPAAKADIYRWTDKEGNVNFSDVAPTREQQVKDVVVVTRSSKTPQPTGPSQQELLARVQSLEQQLQSQQYIAATQAAAPPAVAYYPTPAPAPQVIYQAPPVQPMTYYDNAAYDDGVGLGVPYTYPVAPIYVVSTFKGRGPRFGMNPRGPHGSFRGVPRVPGGRGHPPPAGHSAAVVRR